MKGITPRQCHELFKRWGFVDDRCTKHWIMRHPTTGVRVAIQAPLTRSGKRVSQNILRQGAHAVGVTMHQFAIGPEEKR